jgi:hypothetical protein
MGHLDDVKPRLSEDTLPHLLSRKRGGRSKARILHSIKNIGRPLLNFK